MAMYKRAKRGTRASQGVIVTGRGPVTTIGTSLGWRVLTGAGFGVLASLPMGLVAMFLALIQQGDFFQPLKAIAATFLGPSAVQPGFPVVPVMVGLLFHMFNGAWLGALFGALTPNLGLTGSIIAGILYGLVIGFGALWVVLPALDPVLVKAWSDQISLWAILHVIFGFVLGLYPLARRSTRDTERERSEVAV